VAGINSPSFVGLTSDDSQYIVVDSPGVTDDTDLTFTANGGPGVRWDIVECQPVDTLVSGETRDIFDPVAQSFSSQSVDKVREAQFTFRIRLGTQGAGLLTPDENWMPLAVVMVPSGASGFSDCDLWDVRPLVSERAAVQKRGDTHLVTGTPGGARTVMRELELFADDQSGYVADSKYMAGYYSAEFDGYMVGGDIRKTVGTAGTASFGSIDAATGGQSDRFVPEDPDNIHPLGYSGTAGRVLGVGAFFPSGYVRWARYSQVPLVAGTPPNIARSNGRWPMGARGILVGFDPGSVTVNGNGIIDSGDHLPSQMELGGGGHWGHIVGYTIRRATTGIQCPVTAANDQEHLWHGILDGFSPTLANVTSDFTDVIAGPAATIEMEFDPRANTVSSPIPEAARALIFRVFIQLDIAGGAAEIRATWKVAKTTAGDGAWISGPGEYVHIGSAGARAFEGVIRVPMLPTLPWDGTAKPTMKVGLSLFRQSGAGTLENNGSGARLIGYQM
jgi:hypothetical protein